MISIAVIGEVRSGRAILRSGARAGDLIYVSGVLGLADLGLRQLRQKRGIARISNAAIRKHFYPQPRLELGKWLAENRLATAMMDLSDGLSTDLPRLCAASGVGARVEKDSLPTASLAAESEAQQLALHGGDDYELLFSVSPGNAARLPRRFHGLPLTPIGRITREQRILVESTRGSEPLRPGGWDPFRAN
jgi:thiamine-monophosphate kinase